MSQVSEPKVRARIREICEKHLKDLPVGKGFFCKSFFFILVVRHKIDYPRLARKFLLYKIEELDELQEKEERKHRLAIASAEEDEQLIDSDMDEVQQLISAYDENNTQNLIEYLSEDVKEKINSSEDPEQQNFIVVYHLTQTLNCLVSIATAIPNQEFPSFEEYEKEVNIQDHETITSFLLNRFGDQHPMIKILKGSQQTIIVNILQLAKAALIQTSALQFKDARGEWKIFVKFFKNVEGEWTITLTHRRSEEAYVQRSIAYMQKHGTKSLNEILFQFSWLVTIEYNANNNMYINGVKIRYLGINQTQNGVKLSQEDFKNLKKKYKEENKLLERVFDLLQNSNDITLANSTQLQVVNAKYGEDVMIMNQPNKGPYHTPSASISGSPSSSSTNQGVSTQSIQTNHDNKGFMSFFKNIFTGHNHKSTTTSAAATQSPQRTQSNIYGFDRMGSGGPSASTSTSTGLQTDQSFYSKIWNYVTGTPTTPRGGGSSNKTPASPRNEESQKAHSVPTPTKTEVKSYTVPLEANIADSEESSSNEDKHTKRKSKGYYPETNKRHSGHFGKKKKKKK